MRHLIALLLETGSVSFRTSLRPCVAGASLAIGSLGIGGCAGLPRATTAPEPTPRPALEAQAPVARPLASPLAPTVAAPAAARPTRGELGAEVALTASAARRVAPADTSGISQPVRGPGGIVTEAPF